MRTVISKDSTPIAFNRSGKGASLILVDGMFGYRAFGPMEPLAALLAENFSVFTYDRRGRGESGDTPPYAVEREIEDLAALISEAGGSALVYAISSGAALALQAATRGLAITKLALYEPPFMVDENQPRPPDDFMTQLTQLIALGRCGEAVEFQMIKGMGMPVEVVAQMRNAPMWPMMEAVVHTIVYDIAIMGENKGLLPRQVSSVTVPMFVMDGGASPAWMHNAVQALVNALPNGQYCRLKDQTHNVVPQVLAPVLEGFFAD